MVYQNTNTDPFIYSTGAFYQDISANNMGHAPAGGLAPGRLGDAIVFNASLVARTATETRASNTAFAPRIIAF